GETISTAIGLAVTEPNGCASVKIRTIVKADRWAIADAVMPDCISRRSSTVLDHVFEAAPALPASIAWVTAASIPFRRESEIGEPALGPPHPRDLLHLLL